MLRRRRHQDLRFRRVLGGAAAVELPPRHPQTHKILPHKLA
jgi:hypothetical protein